MCKIKTKFLKYAKEQITSFDIDEQYSKILSGSYDHDILIDMLYNCGYYCSRINELNSLGIHILNIVDDIENSKYYINTCTLLYLLTLIEQVREYKPRALDILYL